MRRLLPTSLVLLLSMPCLPVLADEASSAPLAEGDRVRVRASGAADRAIVGRLLRADQGALAVTRDDGSVVDVPRSAIQALETLRGRRSQANKGAAIGAGAGAGVVLAQTAAEGGCDPDRGGCAVNVAAGLVYAALGALVGAGIGSMVRTDRWVKVDPGRVKVSVAPTRRGVAFSVSLGF